MADELVGRWYYVQFFGGDFEIVKSGDGLVFCTKTFLKGRRDVALEVVVNGWWTNWEHGISLRRDGNKVVLKRSRRGIWGPDVFACNDPFAATGLYFRRCMSLHPRFLYVPPSREQAPKRSLNDSVASSVTAVSFNERRREADSELSISDDVSTLSGRGNIHSFPRSASPFRSSVTGTSQSASTETVPGGNSRRRGCCGFGECILLLCRPRCKARQCFPKHT
eukprot:TRINITY_DN13871_c0_g1_i2.p1 TRINITY_DN13871_c0_g1~~TRINITY_DN13871_c0_g1_i2.p1  ORF type:complete len:249 (-),score=15.67 TRINITY_DN13871_c0_g1_i2:47-712(-)